MAKFTLQDGTEVEAYTQDELTAAITTETAGLKNKVEELLGEKKSVSAKAAELEAAVKLAEETSLKEKQEFKTLYEREQEARRKEQEENGLYRKQIQDKDISIAVSSVSSIAVDDASAELLQRITKDFAKYVDGNIVFEVGGVEVGKDKLLEHLASTYPRLVKGSQASGGGAIGSKNGSGAAKAMTREQFNTKSDFERMEFIRAGGKLTD